MRKLKFIILTLIIFAAIFGVGFYIYKDFVYKEEGYAKNSEENKESENSIKTADKIKIPDLSKSVIIKTILPEDIKTQTISEIKDLSESLTKDYDNLENWIQLGLLKKLIGDYDGARDAWEFASKIRLMDYISRHNLGNLYWQQFKDYENAEKYYLEALEIGKNDISAFIDLSNIYYYDLKDSGKAKEILNKGLKNNHGNEEIKQAMRDMNL